MSSNATNGRPKGRVRFSEEDNVQQAKKRPRTEVTAEEEDHENIPSSKELLEAKYQRRLLRQTATEPTGDTTKIDNTTSLLMEEESGPIEAFNMDNETNDGSGFFDESGTYVFRKRNPGDEPDAWLESLEDNQDFQERPERSDTDSNDPGWTIDELYAKLLPLVSDNETVLQALVRYGGLMKRPTADTKTMARSALNELTEAASALLVKGDVDVYQMTRKDILNKLPEPKEKPKVLWEYLGNKDNQIHGPYTSQEMLSWTQAGYFVGDQAVHIRTIKQEDPTATKSTEDDLLADLMDDDDKQEEKSTAIRGDWVSSNDVDFSSYS